MTEPRTSAGGVSTTRRRFLRAGGAAGAMAIGLGSAVGSAAGSITEFEELTVSEDNRIVNEDGQTVVLRGLNIPDPKRANYTAPIRGKNTEQIIDLITDTSAGWYPRAIRIPAQPVDIGEHRIGADGPVWTADELENPDAVAHDEAGNIIRKKQVPPPVPAFDRDQLETYVEEHLRPAVERCRERGVYCIVDYHRHWHEQPPGTADPWGAENHLPYDNEYTVYWAYNDHEAFGTEAPASWGWVDQTTMTELTPETKGWTGWEGWDDAPDDPAENPYLGENWVVNQDLLAEALLFWDVVGEAFADEPHVIFEAYNEPTEPAIWGPVDGCGAWKQKPLWRTFQDEFMGPILDRIREYHPDRLVLASVPGWAQSTQALHWQNFAEAGYDNVAVTWHNYGGHDVSQLHNWFNDTSYECWVDIENRLQSAGDKEADLENPYHNPPGWSDACGENIFQPESNCTCGSVSSPACWGWEDYEAGGLQNAMAHHPVVVSEFGWRDRDDCSAWIRGSCESSFSTTETYGKPFLEALGEDERVSWLAWNADVRWLPTMFMVDWEVAEGGVTLTDHNWYETDIAALADKYKCNDMPCDWALTNDPNEGEYVKQVLAERSLQQFPIPVGERPAWPPDATDPDGDNLYEDLDGDGTLTFVDVNRFFQHSNTEFVRNNARYYDFTADGSITLQDVMALFEMV